MLVRKVDTKSDVHLLSTPPRPPISAPFQTGLDGGWLPHYLHCAPSRLYTNPVTMGDVRLIINHRILTDCPRVMVVSLK